MIKPNNTVFLERYTKLIQMWIAISEFDGCMTLEDYQDALRSLREKAEYLAEDLKDCILVTEEA